jgi:hypothetical protein
VQVVRIHSLAWPHLQQQQQQQQWWHQGCQAQFGLTASGIGSPSDRSKQPSHSSPDSRSCHRQQAEHNEKAKCCAVSVLAVPAGAPPAPRGFCPCGLASTTNCRSFRFY